MILHRVALVVSLFVGVAGCAYFPSGGPSRAALQNSPAVAVTVVTPQIAASMADARAQERADRLRTAQAILARPVPLSSDRFAAGDRIDVRLWSYAAPQTGTGVSVLPAAAAEQQLGIFELDAQGTVSLPYLGRSRVGGLTRDQAESELRRRYTALRTMVGPTVSIRRIESPARAITVTGAVSQPRVIPWTPAGVTLAEALTLASANGAINLIGQQGREQTLAAARVEVLRDNVSLATLPAPIALRANVALQPGDRIVVDTAPAVQVVVMGSGVGKVGSYGFAEGSTLTDAIAQASGIVGTAADARAIFVLRDRHGAQPILYSFAVTRGEGFVAARRFPIADGDLVYVSEAPTVALSRVVSLMFQLALPAQLVR